MGDTVSELLDNLTDAMLAREDSCHGMSRPHERDRAIAQWHDAVDAIRAALTRDPLPAPAGTAGVEAAAKVLAYRIVGCTEKGWAGDNVFTPEQKAQIRDDARVMIEAYLATSTRTAGGEG